MNNEKLKAISAAVAAIEKQFGKGAIMPLLSADDAVAYVPVIPSGSLGLDLALGVGGLPRGRVIEIGGPESSGKTTLTLHAIAATQKAGGVCAFIDAEHIFDATYAKKLGVNLGQLLVSQPDCGEQALEIADQLVRTGAVDLIVIDSMRALTPRGEIEGDAIDGGLRARLVSQALRKLTAGCAKQNTMVIIVNPLAVEHVVRPDVEANPGSNALKFYAAVRLDIRKIAPGTADTWGVRVKVLKNKVAPPFREAVFDIRFGEGIDVVGEIVDLCLAHGLFEKSGAWYVLDGERIAQSRDAARRFLQGNPEIADALRDRLLTVFRANRAERDY